MTEGSQGSGATIIRPNMRADTPAIDFATTSTPQTLSGSRDQNPSLSISTTSPHILTFLLGLASRKYTAGSTAIPLGCQTRTLTQDAEGGCKSLYTGQFTRPAIVHRVGGHQVRQQPEVASPHLSKRCLFQSGPGAVDDSHP